MRSLAAGLFAMVLAASCGAFSYAQGKTHVGDDLAAKARVHALESQVFALARENAQLRADKATCEAQLASTGLTTESQRLQAERDKLDAELCAAAGIERASCAVDWTKSPPAAAKKAQP